MEGANHLGSKMVPAVRLVHKPQCTNSGSCSSDPRATISMSFLAARVAEEKVFNTQDIPKVEDK